MVDLVNILDPYYLICIRAYLHSVIFFVKMIRNGNQGRYSKVDTESVTVSEPYGNIEGSSAHLLFYVYVWL